MGIHIIVPLGETIAEKHGANTQPFDAVVSWPARLGSALVPEGHGIPQLVLPFIFSLAFYALLSWLLIWLFQWTRKSL